MNTVLPIVTYLKIVFRRQELLLTTTFAGLILGICLAFLLPREYKASTIILVQEGKTDNPMFSNLAIATTVQQRMEAIRESILGWDSMVELIRRLDLGREARSRAQFEGLIENLRRDISIRLKGTSLIYLDYLGKDPVTTQAVVKNLTDILIEKNIQIQNQETAEAIKFIQEQLEVYRGKIKSAEIAQLQDQLNTLLMDATEKHPLVKQIKDQIENKKEELRKENLQYTENIKLSTQTVSPLVDEIKKALDALDTPSVAKTAKVPETVKTDEKDLYKVMLIDKLDNVMARDVNVNEQIYNTLLQRLETAKITQRLQTSKEGTRYTILDPPRVPLKPVKPNVIVVIFTGIFLGLLCGVGLILAEEFLDQSFIDVEEAKVALGVPLLGAISKIVTEDAVREERERLKWFYTLAGSVGAVIVVLSFLISRLIR